jgi:hypothetical protein
MNEQHALWGKKQDFEFMSAHSGYAAVLTIHTSFVLSGSPSPNNARISLRVKRPIRWQGSTEPEEVVVTREYLFMYEVPLFLHRVGSLIGDLLSDPNDRMDKKPSNRPIDRMLFSLCDQLQPLMSYIDELGREWAQNHPRRD